MADRFQLELRRESAPTPIFALVTANGGPKKLTASVAISTPSRNSLQADAAANQQPADAGGISIFTALQQQLGLKLEARTDAADRLIVRAELPSAN